MRSMETRNLIDALNEKGIHVIANKTFDEFRFDFSEHDKKVAEEKDKQIAELEKIINEKLGKWDNLGISFAEILELEDENEEAKRKIKDLEAIIADGKKPDVSVSENGVSFGCECGGYHLAKEKIKVLEKENAELDHMRKSWMETAQKWSELNSGLQDKIANLECVSERMSELEDRHQSDCIEINRLHTALEVMMEKYVKLKEVHKF